MICGLSAICFTCKKQRPRPGKIRRCFLFVKETAGLLFRIVIEIALHQDNRRSLVAAAAGQVAEGTDQVRQPSGRGPLGHHGAYQAGRFFVLFPDVIGNGFL